MQQAAEHAARRNAEAAEKARFEATTPKKAGASRTEPPRHRHQRASSQHQHLIECAWEVYEDRWKAMNAGQFPSPGQLLSFTDIPWPIVGSIHSVEQLEDGRLAGFLLSNAPNGLDQAKLLKQRIRDTMLRFHPDRFDGRWIPHVVEADRAAVKEGVGRVVRFLNDISSKLA
ncbi:hypothetical protein FRB90_009255 [Tulasnella sp. 427]|nr:hypothetical protein FRB90_009255 [Tulasnella sp. 427]